MYGNCVYNLHCENCSLAGDCDLMDVSTYSTKDILADLPGLIVSFGLADETVIEYQKELANRGVSL